MDRGRLARAVHVTDPESGRNIVLPVGSEPVPWIAEKITNPDAWEGGVLPEPEQATRPSEGDPSVPVPDPEPSPTPAADTLPEEPPVVETAPEPVKRPTGRRNTPKGDAAAK
jgi:hypothetical protein